MENSYKEQVERIFGLIKCIYCNKGPIDGFDLISIYAPGTYFQHWDSVNKKGCPENKENIGPSGKKYLK